MSSTTDISTETPMRLLAGGLSISLLWDLVDPLGPASEELFESEG